MNPIFRKNSGVKVLFEDPPSQAVEIDYFETFSRSQENRVAR